MRGGRGVGLAELLEQLCLLFRGHADAGVRDGELDETAAIAHLACRKLDLAGLAADRRQRPDANGGLLSVGPDASEFRIALRAGGRALEVVRAFGLIRPGGAGRAAAPGCGPAPGKSAPGAGATAGAKVRRSAETIKCQIRNAARPAASAHAAHAPRAATPPPRRRAA
jgi:hypothetical protein